MLINHLQEIDWTTLRIIKVNLLCSFKVNTSIYCLTSQTSAKINVKISDLIYNQSQCMTFAKSIIMFVTSIISANNSNKLQRYYFTVISFNISANTKNIFHKIFFFSSSQKVKVKIFSSRQNKNLETLFKKWYEKYFTLSQRNQIFATIKQLLSPLQKVLQRFNLFQILKEVLLISLQRSNNHNRCNLSVTKSYLVYKISNFWKTGNSK